VKTRDIYKQLNIQVGDQLTNAQIIQIATLRQDQFSDALPDTHPLVSDDDIRAALARLDPANDAHWTQGGKPAMKAIEALVHTDAISRKDVDRVRPDFKRLEV